MLIRPSRNLVPQNVDPTLNILSILNNAKKKPVHYDSNSNLGLVTFSTNKEKKEKRWLRILSSAITR